MTFANLLLICLGAIAGCATLVFAVETMVAFCLHEQEEEHSAFTPMFPVLVERPSHHESFDQAA